MSRKSRKNIGSRAEVMHGNAEQTSGGLTKNDLVYNKHGIIVSKKKQKMARDYSNLGDQLYRDKNTLNK